MLVEASTSIPSRGNRSKGLARAPASSRAFPLQASSVSTTERTWAQPYGRVTDTPKRGDASAVVAVSVYKAVNKAAPSKGGPRIATFVIRRPSGSANEGDVTVGHAKAPVAPVPRPGWTVAFSSFGDAAPAMDRVHGLHLYCAPGLLLRRYVVSLPAQNIWGKRTKTPIKGGVARSGKGFDSVSTLGCFQGLGF